MTPKLCECGCGREIRRGTTFAVGHCAGKFDITEAQIERRYQQALMKARARQRDITEHMSWGSSLAGLQGW